MRLLCSIVTIFRKICFNQIVTSRHIDCDFLLTTPDLKRDRKHPPSRPAFGEGASRKQPRFLM